MDEPRDFKFDTLINHSKFHLADQWGVVKVSWPILEFHTPCKISATATLETSDFVHGSAVRSLSLMMSECFLSWRGQGHVSNFYILDLENFAKTSRRYTGDIHNRRRFIYDTYKTMKATRTRHGWVHMFIGHRPTLTLQLQNFDLFRTCRNRVSALLRGNWQDFNWRDASRGPSAIAELVPLTYSIWQQ